MRGSKKAQIRNSPEFTKVSRQSTRSEIEIRDNRSDRQRGGMSWIWSQENDSEIATGPESCGM